MNSGKSGVSGNVEYDLGITCFADEHEPTDLHPTEETSSEHNPIYECPECGARRAVNVHVAPLRGRQ